MLKGISLHMRVLFLYFWKYLLYKILLLYFLRSHHKCFFYQPDFFNKINISYQYVCILYILIIIKQKLLGILHLHTKVKTKKNASYAERALNSVYRKTEREI